MASITVTDIHLLDKSFEELAEPEFKAVVGGGRHKVKVDLDGDGKWDVKVVVRD